MGICGSATKPTADGQDGVKDPSKLKGPSPPSIQTNKPAIESSERKEIGGGPTLGSQSPVVSAIKGNSHGLEGGKSQIEQKLIESPPPTKEVLDKSKREIEEKDRQEKEKEHTKPPKSPTEPKNHLPEKKEVPKHEKKSNMQSHEASRDVDLAEKRANKKRAKVIDVMDEKESGFFENFVKVEKRKNADDTANILTALMGHFFFSNLSTEEL